MEKLDRLVWAESTCLESYGVRIGIRASRAGVLEQTVPFLPPQCKPVAAGRKLDLLYSWVVGGELKPTVRTFHIMYEGAGRIVRTLKPAELFEAFETRLRMAVALLSKRFVFIHAGAVGWGGRSMVIPGRSLTGKSALVEALVRAGAEYLSDEYAVLDRRGRVHPFAKPISVRVQNSMRQEPLPVAQFGGRVAERPMKVGAIVFTRYREAAKSRFRAASPGQGILDLVANTVAARWAPSRVMAATCSAAAGATVLRGPRGDAAEAARRLLALFSGWRMVDEVSYGGSPNGITGNSALVAEG
jgi:hypothetical protein